MTVNKPLVDQLQEHAANFALHENIFFRTMAGFEFLEETDLIFFDEYYHAMRSAKLTTDMLGKPQNLMGLGNYGKQRIMLGGTCDASFKDISKQLFTTIEFID